MTLLESKHKLEELGLSNNVRDFIEQCMSENIPIEEIGYQFEKTKLSNKDQKKKNGQFYTPEHLVRYMIEYLSIESSMKVIDPASGTGTFLIPILKKLYNGTSVNKVYGIDIDHQALEILLAIIHLLDLKIDSENLIHGNTIVSNPTISEHALDVNEIKPEDGFDVVIGNPPYVTLKKDVEFDSTDIAYEGLLNGQVNAATLMIIKGLQMLKTNGVLAFVLPKNILHVGSYSKLRNYLLTKTTILHIVDIRSSFKHVRGEQIILFVQKKLPNQDHKIEMKVFHNPKESANNPSVFIKQSHFAPYNKLSIFERHADYHLIDKLANTGLLLKEVVDDNIFRGISIPSKYLNDAKDKQENIPYIRGKNIQKFSFKVDNFVSKSTLNHLTKEKLHKTMAKKIVVQNIFSSESGIICAIDNEKVLTNETVTNILIEDEVLGNYILGLLQSKLANYYLIYGCYNCSKMTMHTDKEYIGAIPVVITDNKSLFNQVLSIVDGLSKKDKTQNKELELKQELDCCFYSIYNLSKADIHLIETGLNQFLSKKSRW